MAKHDILNNENNYNNNLIPFCMAMTQFDNYSNSNLGSGQ